METLESKPPCDRADAQVVLERLRAAGHVAYFAGGCVRDLLLGREPKDWDVATDAPPARVRELFAQTQAVGQAFGVILVKHRKSVVEVATFRSDGSYEDGRRPSEVRFTTAEEDARRRDFTINGLFLDPVDGRVIDYVGGQEDLKLRRIRAIGDPLARFAEDHLRLLRAVRFAARLGFGVQEATAAAVRRDAPLLKRISPERVADELRLMLTQTTRGEVWTMLWEFGLVEVVMRFLHVDRAASLDADRSIFLHLAPGRAVEFGLALAAAVLCYQWQTMPREADVRPLLARAAAQRMVRAMRQGLKISNEESDQMLGTIEGIGPLLADPPPALAAKKRFLARPTAGASRDLMQAIATVGLYRERIGPLEAELEQISQTDFAPAPLVTGDDLVAAGLVPGPRFKRVLDVVYDAQLENRVGTKAEAMEMALREAAV